MRDCIIWSNELTFLTTVKIWHDSDTCLNLLVCTPTITVCIEKVRLRSAKNDLNIKMNHGGICLFYKANYTVCHLPMPSFKSLNLVVGIIYHPRSSEVNSTYLDEFADFIECVDVYALLIIVGDVNFLLNVLLASSTSRFNGILSTAGLVQHISVQRNVPIIL